MRLRILALCVGIFPLAGCMTPQQSAAEQARAQFDAEQRRTAQLSADRRQCADYGFRQRTRDSGNCMMNLAQQRENLAQQQAATQALVNMQRKAEEENITELAMRRSGDTRFPLCRASSSGATLVFGAGWAGRNCRMN